MSERSEQLREAFAALNRGSAEQFETLLAADGQWLGVPGSGYEGATPIWHDRREVVDLLAQHHAEGRRFEPVDFLEQGPRVAVRLEVTDPHWTGKGEAYKVFTFGGEEPGSPIVLLQDTRGADHARELLAG